MTEQTVTSYPAVSELIPHGENMVLLTKMLSWESGHGVFQLVIDDRDPFFRDNRVCISTAIEYMAQGIAATLGYEAYSGGADVRVGVILAARVFDCHVDELPVQTSLRVECHKTRGNDTLSHFDCSIYRDSEQLTFAILSVYHAAKPPS